MFNLRHYLFIYVYMCAAALRVRAAATAATAAGCSGYRRPRTVVLLLLLLVRLQRLLLLLAELLLRVCSQPHSQPALLANSLAPTQVGGRGEPGCGVTTSQDQHNTYTCLLLLLCTYTHTTQASETANPPAHLSTYPILYNCMLDVGYIL